MNSISKVCIPLLAANRETAYPNKSRLRNLWQRQER